MKPDSQQETTIRNHILKTAAGVFSEKGFVGARMDAITKTANVNKASIYYHIGNKRTLYGEVFREIITSAAQRISKNIHKSDPPEKKLHTYYYTLGSTVRETPYMASIVMHELASGGKNLPETFIHDIFTLLEILTGIFKEGVQKQTFHDTAPFLVHLIFMGSFSFFNAIHGVLKNSPSELIDIHKNFLNDSLDDGLKKIEKIILNGIIKNPDAD